MLTVIETFRDRLYTKIFPECSKAWPEDRRMVPKTLIFAKNDDKLSNQEIETVRDVFLAVETTSA